MNQTPSPHSASLSSQESGSGAWWRGDRALAAWLVLAVGLTYARVWHAGFMWDDDSHLTANPTIVGPLGFPAIWTTAAANYFPLVLTNLWLMHACFGLDPLPYHLMNVALHAACAVLLWRVLRRLTVRGAWLGAALWALHPVQAESVAWISELKNTQSCVFFLLSVHFFLRWIAGTQPRFRSRDYALVVACAVCALLSKPSTVMLPVALLLVAWWQTGRIRVQHLVALLPLFALSGLAGVWTIWEQKFHSFALGPEWNQTWDERCNIAGRAVVFYLGKLLWPQPLIFVYPRWTLATGWLAFVPVLGIGIVAGLLWRVRNGIAGRAVCFALAYFVALLFPVLGFFSVYYFRYSFVADHFQYLSSIGPLALVAAGVAGLIDRLARPGRNAVMFVAGAVALGLVATTINATGSYESDSVLWHTTHEKNPACWMATTILGTEASDHGDQTTALRLHDAAIQLNPLSFEAHYNRGLALKKMGRIDEALTAYHQALQLKPNFPEAEHNLGVALAAAGRLADAIPHYQEALRLKPDQPETQFSLGLALTLTNRATEALPYYEAALRLRPGYAEAHYALARNLEAAGNTAAALQHYREAVRLKPGFAAAQARLAAQLASANAWPEAAAHYAEAARLDPTDADSVDGLATALANSGRTADAIPALERSLQLRPDQPATLCNLGNALLTLGRSPEAIASYERALQLNPRLAEAHYNLAIALQAAGRTAEARDHALVAAQLRPDLPPVPGLAK